MRTISWPLIRSLSVLTISVSVSAEDAESLFQVGQNHYNEGVKTQELRHFQNAVAEWNRAKKLIVGKEPSRVGALITYGLALTQQILNGDRTEILANYEETLKASKVDRRLVDFDIVKACMGNAARILSDLNDQVAAEQKYRDLVALDPDDYDIGGRLAGHLESHLSSEGRSRFNEALALRKRYIGRGSGDLDASIWYGIGRQAELYGNEYINLTLEIVLPAMRKSQQIAAKRWLRSRKEAGGGCQAPIIVRFADWANFTRVGGVVVQIDPWGPEVPRKASLRPTYGVEKPQMLSYHEAAYTWPSQLYTDRPVRIARLRDVALSGENGVILDRLCRVFLLSDDVQVPLHHNLDIEGARTRDGPQVSHVEMATSTVTLFASTFYHFFGVALPRLAVLQALLLEKKEMKVIVPALHSRDSGELEIVGFVPALLALLGIDSERLVPYRVSGENVLSVEKDPSVRFWIDELLVADWEAPGLRGSRPDTHHLASRSALLHLRSIVAPQQNDAILGKVLLVLRRGSRRFPNEMKLREKIVGNLPARWIMEVLPDDSLPPLKDLMHFFGQASVVVGVHGAALLNMIFCPPHATIVELTLPQPHSQTLSHMASAIGLAYWALPLESPNLYSIPEIPEDQVKSLPELIQQVTATIPLNIPEPAEGQATSIMELVQQMARNVEEA